MQSAAVTPEQYINQLPEERKSAIERIRTIIKDNLSGDFEETMSYGMLGYVIPKSIYPDGYHCSPELPLPFINIASQKNFIALYHMGVYAKPELLDWIVKEYPKHCKYKLDMGKSCIRFKKIEDIPFDLIKEIILKMNCDEWIQLYEKNFKPKNK